jgi:hypothetical protein
MALNGLEEPLEKKKELMLHGSCSHGADRFLYLSVSFY